MDIPQQRKVYRSIKPMTYSKQRKQEMETNKVYVVLANAKGVFVPREAITAATGYSDRNVRREVNTLRKYFCIVSTADHTGYMLVKPVKEIKTVRELHAMRELVNHHYNEIKSRINELKKLLKVPGRFMVDLAIKEEELNAELEKLNNDLEYSGEDYRVHDFEEDK